MAMGLSAGTAFITILPDMAKFSGGLAKGMRRASMAMMTTGRQLTHFVTLPVLAAAAASVKMAVDFQASMEQIHTQAGASQKEVNKLSQAVLALAPAVATGPADLAAGLYHIESVGYRGARAMAILKVSALNAKVGMASLEDTASALSAVLVTNIKGTENYTHATAILNGIIGSGNMRMTDLVSALKSGVVPTAKIAGLSLRGLGAAIAMLTDEGVPATTAAMRLRTTLFMLTNPTAKALTVLKSLGLTAKSMGHDMQKPDGLNVAMQDLKRHMADIKDPTQRLADLGAMFGGSRTAGTVAMLLNNLGRIKMKYDQIGKTAGRYASLVAATKNTAKFKLDQAWAKVQVDLVKVGMKLVPIVVQLAGALSSVSDWFTTLSPEWQKIIGYAVLTVAAIGPLLITFGAIGTVLGVAITGFEVIGAAIVTLIGLMPGFTLSVGEGSTAMLAFGEAEAVALGPLSMLAIGIAGIGLAAIGIVALMSSGSTATDQLKTASQQAMSAVDGLNGALKASKSAIHDVKAARHQETQAALGVVQAQNRVNELVKHGKKGTLEYKLAVNQLSTAEDSRYYATQNVNAAEKRLQERTAKSRAEYKKVMDSVSGLTEKYRHQIKANLDNIHVMRGGRIAMTNYGQMMNQNKVDVQAYAKHMEKLSSALAAQAQIAKAQGDPQLAQTEKHLSKVAGAAAQVAQTINGIPTNKQIRIQLAVDATMAVNIHNATARHNLHVGGRASGGPVTAGRDYLVGEIGPELFVPRTSGTIVPNHALQAGVMGRSGSGAMRLVIDNWQEGTGYISSIADDSVNAAGRLTRQKDRMSR